MKSTAVQVRRESVILPTYAPAQPDKNPMFLEKRVYQGSSGKVYPLPFIDRISETKENVEWDAIHLENEFLYAMILPQIGGRIHVLRDKTNGYDLIYNQPVIKPALVGLAGPWISGGIEFNWPQHHRPSTFMPADFEIEHDADGSVTVWLSEHDPMARMKGMHGVCLHPRRAVLELKVRAYNRTSFVQTFLWWANVATRVHEGYQSFFPPDVTSIADHAKRATSEYPLCKGHYYGVDYAERGRAGVPESEIPEKYIPPHCKKENAGKIPAYQPNDLSWYANIPVPTSYMCMGTKEDFFGGYDHKVKSGLVHIADHHIAPGKKQWTWGNHEFGYAWDRNLCDADRDGEHAPYIELMAGVFTDNQPDFSFLQPGETKTWSQYWYPIREIGIAQYANLDAALSLKVEGLSIKFGVSVTGAYPSARVVLKVSGKNVFEKTLDLAPGSPFVHEFKLSQKVKESAVQLSLLDENGKEVATYAPQTKTNASLPAAATEPPEPETISSADELFLTGLHLEQYRHATRSPIPYWLEALRRDPGDARCNNAVGCWHLRRGEFATAETYFRKAIERLTHRNPNPYDGEAYYNLGLCLRFLRQDDEAYEAFYKSVWNQAWQAPAFHALAEIDCRRADWSKALEHLDKAISLNTGNLRARDLKVIVLRYLGRDQDAALLLRETLALDPLDWWARYLDGRELTCDNQVRLDLAHDCVKAGLWSDAIKILTSAQDEPASGTAPLIAYTLGWVLEMSGNSAAAKIARKKGKTASMDYCFAARLEEIAVLESAIKADPRDARAPYYLANLFYDRRRHEEAIRLWEKAVRLEPKNAIAWRNLGIGYFNISQQTAKACAAYDKAFRANPNDARLLYERDQLWKRVGRSPEERLREIEKHRAQVSLRDDLSIELCALYNQTGQHDKALAILSSRNFQPWEGGEGLALGQHVRTHLALGRKGNADAARKHFEAALAIPKNLGEARHLLANQSDVWYWLGCACDRRGETQDARKFWNMAAAFKGDFQEMSVQAFSKMTYYSALSVGRLGNKKAAQKILQGLLVYAQALTKQPAKIDYFATSLPTMLIFDDDLDARQMTKAIFLQAQAKLGLGNSVEARKLLSKVLRRDPNHALARDLAKEIQKS